MRAGNCDLQVSYIEFSSDEKYLLSYSSREPTNPQEKAAMQVNIFDAQTGAKLRKFEGSLEEFAVGSAVMGDGIFKWAASGCAPCPALCHLIPHTSPAGPHSSGECSLQGHPSQADCSPGAAACSFG